MSEADAYVRASESAQSNVMGDQYRHMDSARHDLTPRGLFAPDARESVLPAEPEYRASQSDFVTDIPASPAATDEVTFWKQKYGTSENEKGEWRRRAAEAEESANQSAAVQQQLQSVQQQLALQQQMLQYQGNYGASQAPQQPQRISVFANKQPDDIVTAADVEEAINRFAYEQVAPYVDSRAGLSYQRAVADSQRRFSGWDVRPQEEAAVAAKFPWLSNVPPVERNQFVLEHVKALRAATPVDQPVMRPTPTVVGSTSQFDAPVARTMQAQPQTVMVDPRNVLRRTTYIENAPPAQMTMEPQNTLSPDQAMQRDLATADAAARAEGKPRATAATMKSIMLRYNPGLSGPSDFGSGVLSGS
jgi:hypothetical protein